jgi:hypothetical protein
MMRSIWRHVRLRKGFVNQERAPFGGLKLRIPSLLYSDKIRTQTRFMVGLARSRCTRAGQSSSLALYPRRAKQLARAISTQGKAARSRFTHEAVFGVSRAPV